MQLFVNTASVVEHRVEWLTTPTDLETWLDEHGAQPAGKLTEGDLDRALALREALRDLLRRNNTGEEAPAAIAAVNEAAVRAQLGLALDEAGVLRLDVRGTGLDAALGRVIAVGYGAMLDGSWGRLKSCRKCCWAFYDPSKNRSGTWCSMQLCGNRTKTRAYRRRKADGP